MRSTLPGAARGSDARSTPTIGDFSGTFTWQADPSGFGGRSVGRSTDGTGVLWKATLGNVDAAPYEPLPTCATGSAYLNEVELIVP